MLRLLCLHSWTYGGITKCNLIFNSNIFTWYSNFNLVIVSFESLIARVSFTIFSVGGSSSRTCMSKTVLQVSVIFFFSCSHCSIASSLSLPNCSNFLHRCFFWLCLWFNIDIHCSHSYNYVVIPWWYSFNTWRGSAMTFISTLHHALTRSLSTTTSNLSAPIGTCNILTLKFVSSLCSSCNGWVTCFGCLTTCGNTFRFAMPCCISTKITL